MARGARPHHHVTRVAQLAGSVDHLTLRSWQGTPASSALRLSMGCCVPRAVFIDTEKTPNENALKFMCQRDVLGHSWSKGAVDFATATEARPSPLAARVFAVDGVEGVYLGSDWLTVRKDPAVAWSYVQERVVQAITDHYGAESEVVIDPTYDPDEARIAAEQASSQGTVATDDDEEDEDVKELIHELLDTRIRPMVQNDGGDIRFVRFDRNDGTVYVELQGACSGCASSSVSLKYGVENMMRHYIAEVQSVVAINDGVDESTAKASQDQFAMVEERLRQAAAST